MLFARLFDWRAAATALRAGQSILAKQFGALNYLTLGICRKTGVSGTHSYHQAKYQKTKLRKFCSIALVKLS